MLSDAGSTPPFEPYASRESIRLTTVYSTPWAYAPGHAESTVDAPAGVLNLGRLADFYDRSRQQLPRIIHHEELDCATVSCRRWRGSEPVNAHLWYFVLPSGQVLVALTLDVSGELIDTIPLLEDLYYASIECEGIPLERVAADRIGCTPNQDGMVPGFLPERHQLIFRSIRSEEEVPEADVVQRLIYRTNLPYRPEHSSIQFPAELNRRPTTVGALGPYVSVLCGHQDYVENCVLLSAVQAVGAAARLREIRDVTNSYVQRFRNRSADQRSTRDRRSTLEAISDGLSQLELELSYSVEAGGDIGTLVPALRIESFHNALFSTMGLTERAAIIGQMLSRLGNAIDAELTSVESIEQRAADRRRVRTVVAVTFVTTVTATLSLLFGFFGVNASQVDEQRSMFDERYAPVYALISVILAVGFLIFAGMLLHERWSERRERGSHLWEGVHRILEREFGSVLLTPGRLPPGTRRVPSPRRPDVHGRTTGR